MQQPPPPRIQGATPRPNLEPEAADTFSVLRKELIFARTMGRATPATFVLLAMIGLVYLIVVVWAEVLTSRFAEQIGDTGAIPTEAIIVLGAKNNEAIDGGQYWRLGSSIFLHGGLLHLLVNGYALYVLGTLLERFYGVRRFLILFGAAGYAGAFASYLFTPSNSVGASGAIFGLLGAAIVFGFKYSDILPSRMRRALTIGMLPWVVINIVIGIKVEQIDNAAHMGGLIGGAIVALGLGTTLERPKREQFTSALRWVAVVAIVGVIGWSIWSDFVFSGRCSSSLLNLEYCLTELGVIPLE